MANAYKLLPRFKSGTERLLSCRHLMYGKIRTYPSASIRSTRLFTAQPNRPTMKYYLNSVEEFEQNLILMEPHVNFNFDRNIRMSLYPSDDEIVAELQKCSSIDSVFDILFNTHIQLKHTHICQAILTLWDLRNTYTDSYLHYLSNSDIIKSPEHMLGLYVDNLKKHKNFQGLLELTDTHLSSFNFNEAALCMEFLLNVGIHLKEPIQQSLLNVCNFAMDDGLAVNLLGIMHLSHVLRPINYSGYVCTAKAMIPYIYDYLDKCRTVDDIELITFTLKNIHPFISRAGLSLYISKIEELIKDDILTSEDYGVVVKIINLLNMSHWSNYNHYHTKFLCRMIKERIKNMDIMEVVELGKVSYHHMEPYCIMDEVKHRSAFLMQELRADERVNASVYLPHLFLCQLTTSLPNKRLIYEEMTYEMIKDVYPSTLISFYKIIRSLRSTSKPLSDNFWEKVLDNINPETIGIDSVLRICHKYMYFTHHILINYRHSIFEESMINLLVSGLENSISELIPKKVARISAFIIAYGDINMMSRKDLDYLDKIIAKLEFMKDQFDINDCLVISRALQIKSYKGYVKFSSHDIRHLFHRVDVLLSYCLEKNLLVHVKSYSEINMILKTHINRSGNYENNVFRDLFIKYAHGESELSSRVIRDSLFNFLNSRIVIPSYFERTFDYVVKWKDDIVGELVQKMIFTYYQLGYTTVRSDAIAICCDLINRDKEYMNSFRVLTACLALNYFDCLPEDLVRNIFSMNFMEHLEEEMTVSYSKIKYQQRVRNALMELNRSVCLEFPQYQVPWFHRQYIEEIISRTPAIKTAIHLDITNILLYLTGKRENVKLFHYTPYGHRIDFLLHFDNTGKPLPITLTESTSINKIAVLILHSLTYSTTLNCVETKSFQETLCGPHLIKRKQLELLGYKVVEVPYFLWNSMHMAEPGAKSAFLREKIWQTNS